MNLVHTPNQVQDSFPILVRRSNQDREFRTGGAADGKGSNLVRLRRIRFGLVAAESDFAQRNQIQALSVLEAREASKLANLVRRPGEPGSVREPD